MSKNTKQDILKLAKESDVKFIRLQFTDLFGTLKNVAITVEQLETALDNEQRFDGSSIEGFVRIEESDMVLYPDLDTFVIFPWRPGSGRVARLICDVYRPDGTPLQNDPRHVLKTVLKEAEEMGYEFFVGPELEFFLFHTDESGRPTTTTHDNAGYFDLSPVDLGEDVRRDICLTLEDMGFHIEASHHEVARGQHEIDFRYGPALKVADDIMTFKLVVKTIAKRHGLYATFMPKPIFGINGSGMHVNQSLFKNGENVFCDPSDKLGLSKEAHSYIAGLLEHARGFAAITNPLVNSYKRLVPGYEAPVYLAWAAKNRSPLIRIPAARGKGTRVELRCPDPSTNPYLAIAAVLAAGLDGIKKGLTPPPAMERNIFAMSKEEREAEGIGSLPGSLDEALECLVKDEVIGKALGKGVMESYVSAKEKEAKAYATHVSEWEIERYLEQN